VAVGGRAVAVAVAEGKVTCFVTVGDIGVEAGAWVSVRVGRVWREVEQADRLTANKINR